VQHPRQLSANAQRAKTIRWLRQVHGWLGLWGALLGLLFGVTGILLDHRNTLKIPAVQIEQKEIQLTVPAAYTATKQDFVRYLQQTFEIDHAPFQKKAKPAFKTQSSARFMGKTLAQPEKWEVEFRMPQLKLTAEYVVGNEYALVRKEEVNAWGFLTNLHKGTGASVGWVLMADTLAGGLIVLSITGVLLWTKMRQSRLILAGLMGSSLIMGVWLTLAML
jgi:hypothetical protein